MASRKQKHKDKFATTESKLSADGCSKARSGRPDQRDEEFLLLERILGRRDALLCDNCPGLGERMRDARLRLAGGSGWGKCIRPKDDQIRATRGLGSRNGTCKVGVTE